MKLARKVNSKSPVKAHTTIRDTGRKKPVVDAKPKTAKTTKPKAKAAKKPAKKSNDTKTTKA